MDVVAQYIHTGLHRQARQVIACSSPHTTSSHAYISVTLLSSSRYTHTHTHRERERERMSPFTHCARPKCGHASVHLWLSICIAQQRNLTAPLQAARLLNCAFPRVSCQRQASYHRIRPLPLVLLPASPLTASSMDGWNFATKPRTHLHESVQSLRLPTLAVCFISFDE